MLYKIPPMHECTANYHHVHPYFVVPPRAPVLCEHKCTYVSWMQHHHMHLFFVSTSVHMCINWHTTTCTCSLWAQVYICASTETPPHAPVLCEHKCTYVSWMQHHHFFCAYRTTKHRLKHRYVHLFFFCGHGYMYACTTQKQASGTGILHSLHTSLNKPARLTLLLTLPDLKFLSPALL